MAGSVFQNSYYVVSIIDAILYGMELVLFFQMVRKVMDLRMPTFMDKFMTGFCTVLLLLNTIYWATQVYFGQMMWIIHADYPGGIDAYWAAYSSVWYQTWGTAACVVSNLLSDALLTYRCFVVWNSRRIVILPGLIWLASLTFAIGLLYGSGRPNGDYFAGIGAIFVTAYTASTFAFNVVVTSLICGRIIYVGRCLLPHAGAETKVYTGAVAIVVESALPFTIFSIAYLITFAMGTDIAYAFSFYAMFTCISPLLITLRVLSRRAWTRDNSTLFTTTISYRVPSNYVTPDGLDLSEKGTGEDSKKLSGAITNSNSIPQDTSIGDLPV